MDRGYHHGALRQTLIALALHHLEANNERIEDLSVRALAQEAGVSKGAPRRHFPTADDLVAAVAEHGFSLLNRELPDAADLADLGYRYVAFALHHRQLYRAMFFFPREKLGRFPSLAKEAELAYASLTDHVRNHRSEHGSGSELAAADATIAAWGLVHGLADLAIQELVPGLELPEADTRLREMTAALVRGL
jgi:AcrR family transcriptional regulator